MVRLIENNLQPPFRSFSKQALEEWLGGGTLVTHGSTSIWFHGGGFNHRWRNGIWFTDNPVIAKTYRESVIQKCYLKTEGVPKVIDFKGADWYGYGKGGLVFPDADGDNKLSDKYVLKYFNAGFDCVILKNIRDAGCMPTKGYVPDTVATDCIVKSANQIFWFS